jgi:large subunit ribosomal protein L22
VATAGRQEVQAVAKWVRMSPRKARLVVEHIRGRSVPEARTVLAFTPRGAAREIEKVLGSAVANAEANHNLEGDELMVSAAFVDEGPVLKRWRARARGRAARIHKPTCHITVRLTPIETERKPEAPPAVPPTEAEQPIRPRRPAAEAKPEPKAETSSEEKSETSSREEEASE